MGKYKVVARVHDGQHRTARPVAVMLTGALVIGFLSSAVKLARVEAGAHENVILAGNNTVADNNYENENKSSPTRHSVQTPSGRIGYVEQGAGPVALFVHGV